MAICTLLFKATRTVATLVVDLAKNGFSPSYQYIISLIFGGETVLHKDGRTAAEMKPLIFNGQLEAVPKGKYASNPHKGCAALRNQAILYVEQSTKRLGLEEKPFEHGSSRRGLKKGHPGTRHFHDLKDSASFRQSDLKDDKPRHGQLETHIDSLTLRSTSDIHNLLAGKDNITVALPGIQKTSQDAPVRPATISMVSIL
jgi:hypothetical protein